MEADFCIHNAVRKYIYIYICLFLKRGVEKNRLQKYNEFFKNMTACKFSCI